MAFSVLIPRILSDKTCPFRFPKQRRPNAQLEVSPSVYTIQQGGINQNPNFSISQSINALFPLLPTILTEKKIFDDFTTTCTIGGGFLEVFLLFCNVVSPCTRQALVVSFQWFLKGRNFTNGNTEILYGR